MTKWRKLSHDEREAIKLRRHKNLRQIKGSYVHSERLHGPYKHAGDALLTRFAAHTSVDDGSVLAACNDRHLRELERRGYNTVWQVERPFDPDEIMRGVVHRKPEAQGRLTRFRWENPVAAAFVCERLEEQPNLHEYLVALRRSVAPLGIIALVVPNVHHELIDDHLNLFTAGTLIYNLVRAGWDCSDAFVEFDGRFINVLVRRIDVPEPWPQSVDGIGPFTPFDNVFNYCTSEVATVYRSDHPSGRWG